MGSVSTVGYYDFPKQGELLNREVEVCFHRDTSKTLFGVVVRDDVERPFVTIIKLADNRYVLATECQYTTL